MKTLASLLLATLFCHEFTFAAESQRNADLQFNNVEYSDLLKTMVFLSCNEQDTLAQRMQKVSPYQKLLIYEWRWSDVDPNLSTIDNQHAELEWNKAIDVAIFQRNVQPARTKAESHKYWDEMMETVITITREHLTSDIHSARFVSGAILTVGIEFGRCSDAEKEKSYNALWEFMHQFKNERLRYAICQALHYSLNYRPDTNDKLALDSDMHVANASLWWLASHGKKESLPHYVRTSWNLFEGQIGGVDPSFEAIGVPRATQTLLKDYIPESGNLYSEQSQLQWLETNIERLRWDKDSKCYTLQKVDK